MLIPYSTDAPICYFPYATIGLIVTNIAIPFVLEHSSKTDWLTLQYNMINPLQWITSNFIHTDILHLLGNMVFLWGFGIIVEGKLGWLRFLGLYMLIGVISCAFEQTLFFLLVGEGASLGASTIIFGMLAVAMVWAPQNELTCLLFIRFVPRTIELSIVAYAGIQFTFEIFYFALSGFSISSALLHLSGVVVGLSLGYLYVKKRWVDCEGWDAMTVYFSSTEKQDKVRSEVQDRNRMAAAKEAKQGLDGERNRIIESMTSALQAKQYPAAVAIYNKFSSELQGGAKLPTKLLKPLISAMHSQKQWEPSIPLLVLLLKKLLPEKSIRPRLTLAPILIQITDQPKQGVVVLRKLPKELPEKESQLRAKLAKVAKRALADGSMEIEVHDW